MKSVYKYPLTFGVNKVALRGGFVHFGIQAGVPTLWAEHDDDEDEHNCEFEIVGTGYPISGITCYVGTAFDGPFVWHLYQRVNPK